MVNIEKLEKLSCIHLDEEMKEKLAISIDEVVLMIKKIESVNCSSLKSDSYVKTELTTDAKEILYSMDKSVKGLHLEDKMFLAPKVIKK